MEIGLGSVTASARAVAEARLTSRCRVIRSVHGDTVRDRATGEVVSHQPYEVYEGPCRVRMSNAASAIIVGAGSTVAMQQTQIIFPANTILAIGDEATITESDTPSAVGKKFVIRALALGSQVSSTRYGAEVTS